MGCGCRRRARSFKKSLNEKTVNKKSEKDERELLVEKKFNILKKKVEQGETLTDYQERNFSRMDSFLKRRERIRVRSARVEARKRRIAERDKRIAARNKNNKK